MLHNYLSIYLCSISSPCSCAILYYVYLPVLQKEHGCTLLLCYSVLCLSTSVTKGTWLHLVLVLNYTLHIYLPVFQNEHGCPLLLCYSVLCLSTSVTKGTWLHLALVLNYTLHIYYLSTCVPKGTWLPLALVLDCTIGQDSTIWDLQQLCFKKGSYFLIKQS